MSEWQPIETAPRDGTEVLGGWRLEYTKSWLSQPVKWDTHKKEWKASWDHDEVRPTHWKPLPEPPEDKYVVHFGI